MPANKLILSRLDCSLCVVVVGGVRICCGADGLLFGKKYRYVKLYYCILFLIIEYWILYELNYSMTTLVSYQLHFEFCRRCIRSNSQLCQITYNLSSKLYKNITYLNKLIQEHLVSTSFVSKLIRKNASMSLPRLVFCFRIV